MRQSMDCSQHDALYLLWRLYLHMRAWGTPDYSQLQEPDRTDFTEAVAAGELLDTVENAKRLLLQTGFPAPDSWLAVLAAAPIDRGERLSQADRDELGEILNEILPHIIRAEVGTVAGNAKSTDALDPQARAILFVQDHLKKTGKLPPKTAIAKLLDVDRRTLDNWTAFKVAYANMKRDLSRHRPPPKGSKSADGKLEAWRV